MDEYYLLLGFSVFWVTVISIGSFILYCCLIQPFALATSRTLLYIKMRKVHGGNSTFKMFVKQWLVDFKDHFWVGQDYEAVSNRYFRWEGVFKWKVYPPEN